MTGGMFSRTCYTKLNFDFPYVKSLYAVTHICYGLWHMVDKIIRDMVVTAIIFSEITIKIDPSTNTSSTIYQNSKRNHTSIPQALKLCSVKNSKAQ